MRLTSEPEASRRERMRAESPAVAAALREAAEKINELAELLEASPGEPIGLSWAGPSAAWDRAYEAMRSYQNGPQ